MASEDLVERYLNELAGRMPTESRRAARFLSEVEAHLRDAAEMLQRQGVDPITATTMAVGRFGDAEKLLRQFEREAPLTYEDETMIRSFLLPISVLTLAMSGLFFVAGWFDDAPPLQTIAKSALAAVIAGYCLILLKYEQRTGAKPAWAHWFEFGGALALIAIGAAGAVWTAHLGQTTGDWEYYGFIAAGLLAMQGVLAACRVAMSH